VGNFGFAACQWLMLVVLAKLGRPEMVGQYALALGITAPVMLLANLNLRAVQSTDIRGDHSFASYVQLRLGTTVLALAGCLVAAMVASPSTGTSLVIGCVALAKSAESISDVFYGRLQKSEHMDRIAKSMLFRGIVSLLAMSIVVRLTGNIVWGALSLFLTWLAVLVLYDIRSPVPGTNSPAGRHMAPAIFSLPAWRMLWPLALLALPLGVVQMLISLNANIPRLLIQGYAGEHELGIFAAIAYVTIAGSTLVTAVGQAVSPRLAHLFAHGDRAGFVRLLQTLALLFAAGCGLAIAIVLVAGKPILALLYTREYAEQSGLLIIFTLSFGMGALVSVLGFGITAARRFRSQVPVVALAVTVVTVSGSILVPRLGTIGAAWAGLLSLTVWAIASWFVLRSVLAGLPKASPRTEITHASIGAVSA
jgi:O-antigen/teichoic acid export membrane protein